ncbi:hemolysin III family protein [Aurantibacter crassamenti]|uniref:PAQR family membrane homeostasis protein TrhA n=1 Tax=Aurantibacter crassamenti TaxID=1837375 RepID=UPI0019395F2B|nr:hemolysin III family protein [Aurantibacter crassamenti]MBM1106641.1 hemolysin III family protein [Aurantibacter crassamenti]
MQTKKEYQKEEILNTISHAIGFILAIIGLLLLVQKNSYKSEFATISILVYCGTLISMFAVSTLYHNSKIVAVRNKLRILDHINIYFLIAGTYTPVALITLVHGNGWTIFYTVWIIAIFGTFFKLFYTGKLEFFSLLLYAVMGWLIVLDYDNLINSIPDLGFQLLVLGGVFYTVGIVFYAMRRIPYNHFIWHLFVLGGAISHWLMIYLTVV